jgi:SAM-dependent methyltransferase
MYTRKNKIDDKLATNMFNWVRNINDYAPAERKNLSPVKLPFGIAFLTGVDPYMHSFLYSNAHIKLMESQKFAKTCIPLLDRRIYDMIENVQTDKPKGNLQKKEEFAPVMDSLFEVHAPFQQEIIKTRIDLTENDSVLEIGSATGNLTVKLAKNAERILGIDENKFYNKIAIKKAKSMGLHNCEFSTREYPYDVGEFDYVVCFGVNAGETYQNFRGHDFPADKIILGGFTNSIFPYTKKEKGERKKSFKDFQKRYSVKTSLEKIEEIGDKMSIEVIHLKKL